MKEMLVDLLPIVIAAVGTFIIGIIKAKYTEYVNTDTKKELAMLTVRYVEQVFKALHGDEKLNKAKSAFIKVLNERGIEISEDEVNILLEAAVHKMNEDAGSKENIK